MRKRLLSLFVAVLLAIGATPALPLFSGAASLGISPSYSSLSRAPLMRDEVKAETVSIFNGEGFTAELDTDGVLTVSGSGLIGSAYAAAEDYPWHEEIEKITEVRIGEGITGIGSFAFSGAAALYNVILPDTLTVLFENAFSFSGKISYLKLSNALTELHTGAFYKTTVDTLSCSKSYTVMRAQMTVFGQYNEALLNADWIDAEERLFEIGTYGEGMENLSGETQILICPLIDGIWDDYKERFTKARWTITLTAEDTEKTVYLPVSSVYDEMDWGILRFTPCLEENDENRFVPEKGVNYTLTAEVTIDGVTYSAVCPEPFVLNEEPVTHEFYTVTFTQNGAIEYSITVPSGHIPEYTGSAKDYTEGDLAYIVSLDPELVTDDTVYEVYTVKDMRDMTLGVWDTGGENWANAPGGVATQILLRPYDWLGKPLVGTGPFTESTKAAYDWVLTINGKTYEMLPATFDIANNILRFEPCRAEGDNLFIPVPGVKYSVALTVFTKDNDLLYKTSVNAEVAYYKDFIAVHDHDIVSFKWDWSGELPTATLSITCAACKLTDRTARSAVSENDDGSFTAKAVIGDQSYQTTEYRPAPIYEIGDVNRDGSVNISDVTALLDYLSSAGAVDEDDPSEELSEELSRYDIDQNGLINISDVTTLLDLLSSTADISY